MMGMTNLSFYLSWIMTYLGLMLVVSLVVSYIVVVKVLTSVEFMMFFLIYLMFNVTLIFQAIFVSVFFTKAKPGTVFGIVFFLVQYLLRSFLDTEASVGMLQMISLSPHTALPLAINTMLSFQFSLAKVDFSNYGLMIGNYSIKTAYDSMVFNLFFWMVLSIYLD